MTMLETELIFQALMYNVKLGSLEEPPKIQETFLLPGNWFHTLSRKILKCIWNAKCWQFFISGMSMCCRKYSQFEVKKHFQSCLRTGHCQYFCFKVFCCLETLRWCWKIPSLRVLVFAASWSYGVRMGFCPWSYRNCLRRKAVHTYNIVRKIEKGSQLKKKHEEV